jgi:hypothetical protein
VLAPAEEERDLPAPVRVLGLPSVIVWSVITSSPAGVLSPGPARSAVTATRA